MATTIINIKKCSACGHDHHALEVIKLTKPLEKNGFLYFKYTTCPMTDETILLGAPQPIPAPSKPV